MISPAKIKKGIAINGKESLAVISTCVIRLKGKSIPVKRMVRTLDNIRENPTGTDNNNKIIKLKNKKIAGDINYSSPFLEIHKSIEA